MCQKFVVQGIDDRGWPGATNTVLGASLETKSQMGLEIGRVRRVLDLHPLLVGKWGDLLQHGQY